jgi:hypothetical protein
MSSSLIDRSVGGSGRHAAVLLKDDPHLTTLLSSLRPQSSPNDTRDEDHPESAWRSPDIPPESGVVVFAVARAGRLPALEALVPGSHVALPDSSGFFNLIELP